MTMLKGCNLLCVVSVVREKLRRRHGGRPTDHAHMKTAKEDK